jgi:hypothetical protein
MPAAAGSEEQELGRTRRRYRTLQFARGLLESPAGREDADRWATLKELVDKSRDERERFETLARQASEAYLKVLKGPVDEHHHKIKEAEAELKEWDSS